MLIILPIMLCCTAQNFAYYAQIMLNIYTSVPMFFLVNLHFMGKQ